MFGKKNSNHRSASGGITLLATSVEVTGDIHFSGDLEVEGTVNGNVSADEQSDARIRLMEKGKVNGDIHAPRIVINGHVTGDVYATEHLELAANAVVNGNVHYCVIEMVKGAEVNGSLVHIVEGQDTPSKFKSTSGSAQETADVAELSSAVKSA